MSDVPQPRRSTALIISICLNIALIAMILAALASAFFRPFPHHWEGGPLGLHAMMDIAAPQERARIEDIVERDRPQLKALADRARDARVAAYKIFAQANFSRDAYSKALDQARQANDALQAEVSAMMVDAAAQLSPEERQTLAAQAARKSRWHGGFRHRFW